MAGLKLQVMKYIIPILLSFAFSTQSISQNINDTNVINYSYKLQGYNKKINSLINTGTGFILNWGHEYFLITNFHVLTGKEAATNKKMDVLTDTCTDIIIWFQNDTGTGFKKLVAKLYDSVGNKLYSLYYTNKNQILDIAVVYISPADLPPIIKKHFITMTDIYFQEPGGKTYVVGFPDGKMIDGWKPTIINSHSVEPVKDTSIKHLFLFEDTTYGGMSGCPVYIKQSINLNWLQLIAINAMNATFYSNPRDSKRYGTAIYFRYVFEIIREILKGSKTTADFYSK